jgi:hypothetical protein
VHKGLYLSTRMVVQKDGRNYECKWLIRFAARNSPRQWKCGCCSRGWLRPWFDECKVCHAKVSVR